jgi:hypothetical protein
VGVREERRRKPCSPPHRRCHKRIQRTPPLRSRSQAFRPFATTVNEHKLIVSKKRLTLDSTFEFLKGILSHSKQIQMEALVSCRLDWALLRIMHLVVSIRQRNPTTPIYTQKVDWSKAYRREHYSASTRQTYCLSLSVSPLATFQMCPDSANGTR